MRHSLKPVATKISWGTDQGSQQKKVHSWELRNFKSEPMRTNGKQHLPSHLASTREQSEESERTTSAIDLHQLKNHQIYSVRAKSWVHLIPGRRTERAIKVRQVLGSSVRKILSGRHVNQVYGQVPGHREGEDGFQDIWICRGPQDFPFPAVQLDLVVDKSINPDIISIEQQTFKTVEEGLSFFHCYRLAAEAHMVRRPPHPENEASECKVRWMWRSHFQGRKRSHEPRNLQWRSSSGSSLEIRSLVLGDLTPREIAWRAELVNKLAAWTNKQREWFSQRTLEVLQRDCLMTQNTLS